MQATIRSDGDGIRRRAPSTPAPPSGRDDPGTQEPAVGTAGSSEAPAAPLADPGAGVPPEDGGESGLAWA
jgi:hypothetical protein